MFKEFKSARQRDQGVEHAFTLHDERYEVSPDAPGGILLDIAAVSSDANASAGDQMAALTGFLDAVLINGSGERFAANLRNPDNPIVIAELLEVVTWLVEEVYSARPTVGPSPSPPTPFTTGQPSTDSVPFMASTPSASPSTDS